MTQLCGCGCGDPAPIAHQSDTKRGYVKGQSRRFIHGHAPRGRSRPDLVKTERIRIEDRGYVTPCHIWLLRITRKGYGQEWNAQLGRMDFAHRVAYERAYGPVPVGLELDHRCAQRACVNPEHLAAITHRENVRLAWQRKSIIKPKGST